MFGLRRTSSASKRTRCDPFRDKQIAGRYNHWVALNTEIDKQKDRRGAEGYRNIAALSYENSPSNNAHRQIDSAPQVLLNSHTFPPEEVVRLARQYGVPVVKNNSLAALLGDVEQDGYIPRELYEAVAILFLTLKKYCGRVF